MATTTSCTAEQIATNTCKFDVNEALCIKGIATNTCKFDVNEALCIKGACKDDGSYNAGTANNPNILVQDIFLTATMLIGTVVTLVLVVSGVKYIMAGSGDSGAANEAKKGIKNAIIGLIIVTFSYTIVRVIQYIVAGYR